MTFNNRIIRKFFDRVHGVIAADVDKCLDLQLVQDTENFLINLHVLMDLRKFVTAGTKKCRRCPLQQLDIHIRMNLRGKIHVLLIQKSLDAVKHTVYFVKTTFNRCLVNPRKAGINNRSRPA